MAVGRCPRGARGGRRDPGRRCCSSATTPPTAGVPPFGATAVEPPPVVAGNPFARSLTALRDASRTRIFWLLAGTFFICGATTVGIVGTHLIPAAHDHGIGEVQAASLLAVIGVFDLIGVTTSGWLTDRWDPARLLFCFYALRGLSLFFLPLVLGQTALGTAAFVVVFGLDWVATVPPTVAITVARVRPRAARAWCSAGSSRPTSSAPRRPRGRAAWSARRRTPTSRRSSARGSSGSPPRR